MPQDLPDQQRILYLLQDLHGIEPLRQLFCTELNYTYKNAPISLTRAPDELERFNTADDPLLFATGGEDEGFHIIYTRLNSHRLRLTDERSIISRLLRDHPYALFIFSNSEQTDWHFVNPKYDEEHPEKRRLYRRISVSPSEKLRTASERIAMLDAESLDSPLEIQNRHDKAFDVEAVTNEFFKSYQTVFQRLQTDLTNQTNDKQWAHDYALQFLNRCMFLYFIQRKRWLDDDAEFLSSFWESYRTSPPSADSFVERWLNVLFFRAFNHKPHGAHRYFPVAIVKAISSAPYLNGGLFTENDLDNAHRFQISDSRFKEIFSFLESYNFTIAEDSPLDQEVAVDPEMIGKVYESLVNVSEETDERGDAGIFYTPRTEIDLMCRLALVDNLTNHLGEEHKSTLYEAVLAFDPDDKTAADQKLRDRNLWNPLDECLKELAILDPACGSGSFLVGMLHVLDDLRERANRQLGNDERSFDRKKAIIGGNLYGVDVMEWACHVAELRLWLALIIDADISHGELRENTQPLLPHFSFNIRCGNSLVQEIGGLNLAQILADFGGVSNDLKDEVKVLREEKLKFFNNDDTRQYRSKLALEQAEVTLFRKLLDSQVNVIKRKINVLQDEIRAAGVRQLNIHGEAEPPGTGELDRETQVWQEQIKTHTEHCDELKQTWFAIGNAPTLPFVWDIAFVQIFADEKGGFDIVIGNPPYVRQESIADPNLPRENITPENQKAQKKAYKARLARSVYQAFPDFFGYKREKDTSLARLSSAVSHKLDGKSDLYIYFYFHGLSLLNPKGSFCFITSNSWLDVRYGKDLQEFLLKHCHIKQIIDNQARRSFASADINTVICLFSAPEEKRLSGLDKTARFTMFTTPFGGVLNPIIFEEVEEAIERKSTEEHRIFPISQQTLLEAGTDCQTTKYSGDKWGGKYLRSLDIYWTILEKGRDKLVRLGDVAEVCRGFTTGANEFFYLDEDAVERWRIEDEFLKPVIKSPQECKSILIDPSRLKSKLFMCHNDKEDLAGTAALAYIEWGESKGINEKPSCLGRTRWWDLGEWEYPDMLWSDAYNARFGCFENAGDYFGDKRFFVMKFKSENLVTRAYLNSTIIPLMIETEGITNLGEGVVYTNVYWLKTLLVLDSFESVHELRECYDRIKIREILPIFDEIDQPDRCAIDALIFDALNLTQGERDGVYEAVVRMVEARLSRARSLQGH